MHLRQFDDCFAVSLGIYPSTGTSAIASRQILINAVIGKVKSPEIHISGNPTNQDLASRNVPTGLLARNNFRLAPSFAQNWVGRYRVESKVISSNRTNYPFHDKTIHVTCCGRICLHRKKINLSTVFAGQAVGIKEVEEGIWLVSFMDYDLGYIDLEERTLQPLENPFGPKVLPM